MQSVVVSFALAVIVTLLAAVVQLLSRKNGRKHWTAAKWVAICMGPLLFVVNFIIVDWLLSWLLYGHGDARNGLTIVFDLFLAALVCWIAAFIRKAKDQPVYDFDGAYPESDFDFGTDAYYSSTGPSTYRYDLEHPTNRGYVDNTGRSDESFSAEPAGVNPETDISGSADDTGSEMSGPGMEPPDVDPEVLQPEPVHYTRKYAGALVTTFVFFVSAALFTLTGGGSNSGAFANGNSNSPNASQLAPSASPSSSASPVPSDTPSATPDTPAPAAPTAPPTATPAPAAVPPTPSPVATPVQQPSAQATPAPAAPQAPPPANAATPAPAAQPTPPSVPATPVPVATPAHHPAPAAKPAKPAPAAPPKSPPTPAITLPAAAPTAPPTVPPASAAAPVPVKNVYILGDSITERSASALQDAFGQKGMHVEVNAQASRKLDAPGQDKDKTTGMQAIASDQAKIKQSQAVIVALGTNGGDTPASVDQAVLAIKAINPNAKVYWVDTIGVNAHDFGPAQMTEANRAIWGQSASGATYNVISWFKTVDGPTSDPRAPGITQDPSGLIDKSDGLGVHPTPGTGTKAFAKVIADQVGGGQ